MDEMKTRWLTLGCVLAIILFLVIVYQYNYHVLGGQCTNRTGVVNTLLCR
jgi:hypothetical protein